MFALEAKKMGYEVGVLDPEENGPAAQVADFSLVADYTDEAAIAALAEKCEVLTYEFENVSAAAVEAAVRGRCQLHPHPRVLHLTQNREREKTFLAEHGFPCAPFAVVHSGETLAAALTRLGPEAVLKTADFGYDGKGQMRLRPGLDPTAVWFDFGAPRGVVEQWISFAAEISVVCARWADGTTRTFPVAENHHRHHILDVSIVPARVPSDIQEKARQLACAIAEKLGVVGLLTVELFVTPEGELLVNELAPRPHNSGHYSFDACLCSQFAQHLRAVCHLPPGDPQLLRPVVMSNLLGDLWPPEGAPAWVRLLGVPGTTLHLYGKKSARPGRKMGHFCNLAATPEEALALADQARALLGLPPVPAPPHFS
jgi:5-(carboxyamino)imidazole ribonucleotide synthase